MPLLPADLDALLQPYLQLYPAERTELAGLLAQIADDDTAMFGRKNMRGHLCASGLVLNPAQDSILFIHHKGYDSWMQPGGHFEEDASLWDAACREVREETGLAGLTPHAWHTTHPFPFDIHTHAIEARAEKQEGAHFHYDCVYLMVSDSEAFTIQPDEIGGARWIPLGQLADYSGQRLHQRFLPKLKHALG